MRLSVLLVTAILMAVLLDGSMAQRGGRGVGGRRRTPAGGAGGRPQGRASKMRPILCEVTNTTSGDSCTATCPDFTDCTKKPQRGNRTTDMVIKFCKPKECDAAAALDTCPEGSVCTTMTRRRVSKSFCRPEDFASIAIPEDEERCELPSPPRRPAGGRGQGGRPGGRGQGGRGRGGRGRGGRGQGGRGRGGRQGGQGDEAAAGVP